MKVCAAVLASGMGTRFGGDKISALMGGKQVVCYAVDDLVAAGLEEIMLVVRPETVAERLACNGEAKIVRNAHYREGMASSIRTAVNNAGNGCDGLLLVNGDMPLFGQARYREMVAIFLNNPDCIVAATVSGVRRNPAIFPASMMKELLGLKGEDGGRKLLASYSGNVVEYAVGSITAVMDIDTPQDLEKANSILRNQGKRT
ncbi:MAG: nucleotidyltransferase family protein [Cuniculiplasma divulgatum]|nr:MAG: nucleotidyltransferase family protein [Cuniculiplasma divulgatum]